MKGTTFGTTICALSYFFLQSNDIKICYNIDNKLLNG